MACIFLHNPHNIGVGIIFYNPYNVWQVQLALLPTFGNQDSEQKSDFLKSQTSCWQSLGHEFLFPDSQVHAAFARLKVLKNGDSLFGSNEGFQK